ncbi:MAG: protease modulator HflC [Nitrospinota bacterium]
MTKRIGIILVAVILAIIVSNAAFYTVSEREQVIVTQLGKPVRKVQEPGLYVRIPFVQQLHYFDKRLLEYDAAPTEIITRDKKTLVVDNFSRWRIVDPLLFLQTVRDEAGAQARLDDIIYSELRVDLGLTTLLEIVATKRAELMEEVTERSNEKAKVYGIEIVDVRIKRADLPPENEKAVFGRMEAERQRKARQYRSEGKEAAQRIRSQTDKERIELLAEAYKKEQEIKGEGDAMAVRVYAEAYEKDPEFYAFLRTLDAYKKALKDKATLFLPPESEFLQFLNNQFGADRKKD